MSTKKIKITTKLQSLFKEYGFAGLDKAFYDKNLSLINERNLTMLKKALIFFSTILFTLLIVSFFSERILPFRVFNLIYLFLFIGMYFITKKVKILKPNTWTLISYEFMVISESFVFFLVLCFNYDITFVSLFIVCQILLPEIIIDKPYRIIIFMIGTTIAFDICLAKLNTTPYLDFIIFETIVFGLIGLFINFQVINSKLTDAMRIRGVEIERDTDSLIEIDSRSKLFRDLDKLKVNQIAGIMMMDIDNFKNYNDDYGHQMGDYCLKSVGKKLKEFDEKFKLKSARYGGEEFITYSTFHNSEELGDLAKTLVKEIYDLNIEFEKSINQRVTISIGYTTIEDNPESIKQYISFADTALYLAKALGKNRAASYRKS